MPLIKYKIYNSFYVLQTPEDFDWWYVGMIFVKTDLHLGVLWGCMDCWLWKGDAANPGHSIVRCRASGPWNLFFFSPCIWCVFLPWCRHKGPVAAGSWELELISLLAGTRVALLQTIARCHCYRHGNRACTAVSTVVRALFFLSRIRFAHGIQIIVVLRMIREELLIV